MKQSLELDVIKFERAFIKVISFAVAPLVVIAFTFFTGLTDVDALSNSLILGEEPAFKTFEDDNSLGIVIEPDSSIDQEGKATSNEEMSMEDIFGSEQVFPFEPGLGNHGGAVRGINGELGAY